MKQLILLLCMGLLLFSTTVTAADRVQQVKAMQQGNRMVLEYTLTGDKPTTVSFSVTANGKKYIADKLHLEGDVGKNIVPGRRRLVWNVLQDFPRGLHGQVDWSLNAGGGNEGLTDPTTGMEFVAVPKGFSIGKYEVTQGQWKKVMSGFFSSNPSKFSGCGDNCPVDSVSWNDAQQFIQRLNQQSGVSYRLPTEAEWEYACRAGENHEYCGSNDINAVAWYDGNSKSQSHPVGQKEANAWGIHDMSGNLMEWMQDSDGNARVLRGGSWLSKPGYVHPAIRVNNGSRKGNSDDGFRLVLPSVQ